MSPRNQRRRPAHASLKLARLDRDKLAFGPLRIPRASDRAAFAEYLRTRRAAK